VVVDEQAEPYIFDAPLGEPTGRGNGDKLRFVRRPGCIGEHLDTVGRQRVPIRAIRHPIDIWTQLLVSVDRYRLAEVMHRAQAAEAVLSSIRRVRVGRENALQRLVLVAPRILRDVVEQGARLGIFGADVDANGVVDSRSHSRSTPVSEKLVQVDFTQRIR